MLDEISTDNTNYNLYDINYDICNFVFEGGGTKGLAYVGLMEELKKLNMYDTNILNFAGSSAGAITASILY